MFCYVFLIRRHNSITHVSVFLFLIVCLSKPKKIIFCYDNFLFASGSLYIVVYLLITYLLIYLSTYFFKSHHNKFFFLILFFLYLVICCSISLWFMTLYYIILCHIILYSIILYDIELYHIYIYTQNFHAICLVGMYFIPFPSFCLAMLALQQFFT